MMEQDGFHGPVNLGNPNEITVKQLGEAVVSMTGSSSEFTVKPLPQDDPVRRQPDISLAKEKLQWQPEIDLETGLTKTIDDFKARLAEQPIS